MEIPVNIRAGIDWLLIFPEKMNTSKSYVDTMQNLYKSYVEAFESSVNVSYTDDRKFVLEMKTGMLVTPFYNQWNYLVRTVLTTAHVAEDQMLSLTYLYATYRIVKSRVL